LRFGDLGGGHELGEKFFGLLAGSISLRGCNATPRISAHMVFGDAIAHCLDDPAAVFGNPAVNQFRPVVTQGRKGTSLVRAHQARIGNNISRYDGRQPVLRFLSHDASLMSWLMRIHPR